MQLEVAGKAVVAAAVEAYWMQQEVAGVVVEVVATEAVED
jgi:hypothetical protein